MSAERDLHERVSAVEHKVDALAEAVATGFADQREYTDSVVGHVNGRFTQIDGGFTQIDGRFAQIDGRFAQIDRRFAQIDGRFAQIDGRFGQMDARFDRLEHKLDGFIDTQSRFNQLAERRLERLEQRDSPKQVKRR